MRILNSQGLVLVVRLLLFLLGFTTNLSVLNNNILSGIELRDVGIAKDRFFFPQQNKNKNSVSNAIQPI